VLPHSTLPLTLFVLSFLLIRFTFLLHFPPSPLTPPTPSPPLILARPRTCSNKMTTLPPSFSSPPCLLRFPFTSSHTPFTGRAFIWKLVLGNSYTSQQHGAQAFFPSFRALNYFWRLFQRHPQFVIAPSPTRPSVGGRMAILPFGWGLVTSRLTFFRRLSKDDCGRQVTFDFRSPPFCWHPQRALDRLPGPKGRSHLVFFLPLVYPRGRNLLCSMGTPGSPPLAGKESGT